MITLAFQALRGDSTVLARAAYFRICEDATLRGPDNTIVATYGEHVWQFGQRQFRGFECNGPVYLRMTKAEGPAAQIGPYQFLRAAEGALYTHESCLGIYGSGWKPGSSEDRWREIVLLPAHVAT